MALILRNSVFFHIPKTGGATVRACLRKAMGADRELGMDHSIPAEFPQVISAKAPFAFVRNPESWYLSFFGYRLQDNWILPMNAGRTALDNYCQSNNFDEFIDKVYTRCHGYLTTLYGMFLDSPTVEDIGRTETLTEDLIRFLDKNNEPYKKSILMSIPRQNTSEHTKRIAKETKKKIRSMEAEIYERYKYA